MVCGLLICTREGKLALKASLFCQACMCVHHFPLLSLSCTIACEKDVAQCLELTCGYSNVFLFWDSLHQAITSTQILSALLNWWEIFSLILSHTLVTQERDQGFVDSPQHNQNLPAPGFLTSILFIACGYLWNDKFCFLLWGTTPLSPLAS